MPLCQECWNKLKTSEEHARVCRTCLEQSRLTDYIENKKPEDGRR